MKYLVRSCWLFSSLFCWFFSSAQVPVLNSYPTASAAIFLDFDGHTVDGTSWNWSGSPIVCGVSGLSTAGITEIFNRVAEDYRPFNINITTDSTKFLSAPADQRMRVIITTSSSWYGNTAGGVAFISSFTWGDDHPCFVFSALLGYNVKKISEAVSHESGHTLGLYHQSQYDGNCYKLTDYHAGLGTGEIGWAPIMGIGYNQNFTLWANGPNSFGCTSYQSDLDIITSAPNRFGYRQDDHGDTITEATAALFTNNQFDINGIIQQNTDEDVFRFIMPGKATFKLNATPYNVGTGNAGSDLDMQITLYNELNQLLNVYNPGALLNSVADTILNPGVYYLTVEGKGNIYAPAYASLGSYSLKANIEGGVVLPTLKIRLLGLHIPKLQQFSWTIDADDTVTHQTLEISTNGKSFLPLAEMTTKDRSYSYDPLLTDNNQNQYRLNVVFADGHHYYSNIVVLTKNEVVHKPEIIGNVINSGIVYVNSPGNYQYTIFDYTGKAITGGKLITGMNKVSLNNSISGIYIIRFSGNNQQWTDKILRQ
jgi:prepilin-type processing-associated H-X9-DG protein